MIVKILYASSLCSDVTLKKLFTSSNKKQGLAAQKFHKLLVEGFIINKQKVDVLSARPVSRSSHNKLFWRGLTEQFENLIYYYPPFLNFPVLRHIILFFGSFFYTLSWTSKKSYENKVIICDVLNITVAFAANLAARITNTKCIAIVTDLQKNMGAAQKNARHTKLIPRIITKFSDLFINNFDMYVVLTEAMNEVVNPKQKPHIVMEGLVDINMEGRVHQPFDDNERIIIYAGGIYEKYGVRKLIDAFHLINFPNVRLHVYGPGEMEKDMAYLMERDKRLIYHGTVPNEIVVGEQLKATLLVNPRPTSNEFTKYSFPSKNLEYLVSGTPLLTTALPGMPEEYYEFVYIINEETVDGIKTVLTDILEKQPEDLEKFGAKAKQFVLTKKNNIIQSQRVMSLFGNNLR